MYLVIFQSILRHLFKLVVSCSTYSFKSFIQLSDYTGCAVCVRFTKRIRLIYSGIKTTLVVLLRLIYEIELTLFENYTTQVVLHVLGLQKINRVIRVIHLKIGLHWLCCMCLNHQEVQRHFFWESYYTGCTVCVWFTNIKKLIFSEIRLNWLCCMCLVYKKKKRKKKACYWGIHCFSLASLMMKCTEASETCLHGASAVFLSFLCGF